MNTSLHSSTENTSLIELRRLEEFLAAKLDSVHQSGRKSDSRFLRALEELHEILSLGLTSLRCRPQESQPERSQPRARVALPITVDVPVELELAQDEFLLDFGEEILCLEACRELRSGFLPTRLRRREARHAR